MGEDVDLVTVCSDWQDKTDFFFNPNWNQIADVEAVL